MEIVTHALHVCIVQFAPVHVINIQNINIILNIVYHVTKPNNFHKLIVHLFPLLECNTRSSGNCWW